MADDELTPEEEAELERLEELQAKRERARTKPETPDATTKPGSWKPLIVIAAIAFAIYAVVQSRESDDDVAVNVPLGPVEVTYQLGGTARSADITYTGDGGSTEQQNGVDVPLKTTGGQPGLRVLLDPGEFAYLSAQNQGDGSITCSIRAGGRVIDEATSRGEFAIASCSGSVR